MEKPDDCPDILYDYMKYCWRFKASERPTFNELVEKLLPYARSDFENVSFYHNGLQSEIQQDQRVLDVPKTSIPNSNILKRESTDIKHQVEMANNVSKGSSLPLEQMSP